MKCAPHILSDDNAYHNLSYFHERVGESDVMFSYNAFIKGKRASVIAMHCSDVNDEYIFVADFNDNDTWSEMYSSTIYPDQRIAKFAVMQAYEKFGSNPSVLSEEWGEFQQTAGLVVPNNYDRIAFGAILRELRSNYA